MSKSLDKFFKAQEEFKTAEQQIEKRFLACKEVVYNTLIKCNSGAQVGFTSRTYRWAYLRNFSVDFSKADAIYVNTPRAYEYEAHVSWDLLSMSDREIAKKVRETYRRERLAEFKTKLRTEERELASSRIKAQSAADIHRLHVESHDYISQIINREEGSNTK